MKKLFTLTILVLSIAQNIQAQGFISGDLELRNDYYVKDSTIGASGTNHYDDLKSSTDGWLTVNYNNEDWGFRTGMRLDMFLNSRFHKFKKMTL